VPPQECRPADGAEPTIEQLIATRTPGMALPRPFYMSPSVFNHDMERIFRRHWHCAGHASRVAKVGDYFMIPFEDEQVIIVRAQQDQIFALLNVCRHRGARICDKSSGNLAGFVCPYHAWTYRLDGSLRGARNMPPGFDTKAHGLRRVHVRVSEGLVFINFAEQPLDFDVVAETLRTSCGRYGWANAKVAYSETYSFSANWKLAVENYVECYHCAPAHPEYAKTHALEQPIERIQKLNADLEARTRALGVEILSADRWQNSRSGQETIDAFRYALYDGVASGSEDGSAVAPLMGQFAASDGGVTSIHVGGSTFLVCYPDYGMIYRFVPRAPQSTDMELIWLVRADAVEGRDYDVDKLTWLWKVTTLEDKDIIERTAGGVRSHYFTPGPLAPMEVNERRYLDWYIDEIRTEPEPQGRAGSVALRMQNA
jgi:phenylpropionate dioxygenase-like ring-hydroxylating dioxygenase large terminal subunit